MSKRQDRTREPRSSQLGWTLIVTSTLLILFSLFLPQAPPEQSQPYSKFIDAVEGDRVEKVIISSNSIEYFLKSATGGDKSERVFTTIPVAQDTELPQILREHQVEFSATPSNSGDGFWGFVKLLFFLFLIINLGGLLFGRDREGGVGASPFTIGRSNARIYSEGSMDITFDDVAGVDEAKTELYEIVDFLRHGAKYIRLGAKIPKGVLLVGPPGTGKTLLAKAIAGEAKVPFFSISGSEFIELFVGVGASRVRDLFDRAKKQAPAIVFIDELDALGKSRAASGSLMGGMTNENRLSINYWQKWTVLNQMQGSSY